VTAGLVLAMAVVALEVTVVTTALPTIVGELDRLDLYPWVFAAYQLTSTVTVPVYGKLADLYGRRPVFLFGIALFLVGSVLCGLARGMEELVAFRALQGLGAGAVMPTIFTLIADLYRLDERARVQGLFSGLWGVASLLGPALGAWLTLSWSWRGVFFVGVPFGLAAGVLLWLFFKEQVAPKRVSLDWAGAILLTASLTVLLLAMTAGAQLSPLSPAGLGLLGLSAALLTAFVVAERRAADPVLPLNLFEMRIFSVSALGNFLSGAVLLGVTAYVPLYVQGVLGDDAAGAGAVLTPMLLAWALSGLFGPRILLRFGFRPASIGAATLIALGVLGILLAATTGSRPVLYLAVMVMGLGFGPSTAALVMAVQEAVPWGLRGVATSSTQLFRNLGGTIGVALLGAVLQASLAARLAAAGLGDVAAGALLDPLARASLPAEVQSTLQVALDAALRPVFLLTLLLATANVAALAFFARGDAAALRRSTPAAPTEPNPATTSV